MDNKELRTLVRDLANALLNTVSKLEDADELFREGKHAKEMKIYDRAIEWLHEQNKG